MLVSRSERIALLVAVQAALLWAGLAVLGWSAIGGFLAGLVGGAIGAGFATLGTDKALVARERAARAAVREHRDPGLDLRQETDTQARTLLATPTLERWAPGSMFVGLAVACVVVAVVRADPAIAYPAVPLLILAAVLVLLRRRTDALADRWLADPPVPTDADT